MMCRLYQMWINRVLDDGRPLPARVERHLAACEECRRWHERQSLVVQRLLAGRRSVGAIGAAVSTGEDAAGATEVASPFLRARILNEIIRDPGREAPVAFVRWLWAGGVAAAITLAMVLTQWRTEPAADLIARDQPTATHTHASAVFLNVTTRLSDGGQLLLVATDFDQPLQNEMNLVLGDARAALRSLQSEFLPGTLLAKRD